MLCKSDEGMEVAWPCSWRTLDRREVWTVDDQLRDVLNLKQRIKLVVPDGSTGDAISPESPSYKPWHVELDLLLGRLGDIALDHYCHA